MYRVLIGSLLLTITAWDWASAPDDEQTQDRDRRVCAWSQWGQSAAHDGSVCVAGQDTDRELDTLTFDPFVEQEKAEAFGSLVVHYQAPLNDDDGNVFMMTKTGEYISCDPPGSGIPFPCGIDSPQHEQIWNEKRFYWHRGELVESWSFASDWKPLPFFFGWESMFQPAVDGPFIYIPGAGGTVWQVSKWFGFPVRRINPFPTFDPNNFVSGGITIDRQGNLYWNVLHLHDPATFSLTGQLIKMAPNGHIRRLDYGSIPGTPAADDLCFDSFFFQVPRPAFPWPPPDQPDGSPTLPPQSVCGAQRPSLNMTPAVGRDGTIYTASAAAFNSSYSFIIALRPDLTVKWATSLRDLVLDGCGILVPYGPTRRDCREGATLGVDPLTNMAPALQVDDFASSTPVALPDGGVLLGTLDNLTARGHLVKLDRDGDFAGTYLFGWDVTPAVWEHDGTYSIIVKDNHYETNGPFFMTQLSADLVPEWQFANTETRTCERVPGGGIECEDTSDIHPDGVEWCINAPTVDRDGTVYATAADGFFYAIEQGGVLKSRVFLDKATGAAYTPLSIDPRGRVYALNNGTMSVLGR